MEIHAFVVVGCTPSNPLVVVFVVADLTSLLLFLLSMAKTLKMNKRYIEPDKIHCRVTNLLVPEPQREEDAKEQTCRCS